MAKSVIQKCTHQNSVIFPEVGKLISEGKTVTMKVKGNSMLPFIKDKDTIKLEKYNNLKLYDIVLACIGENQYVLHRIIAMDGNRLTLMGDGNLKGCEKCRKEDVLAIAVNVIRKGKEYNCRDYLHIRKARIWNFLLPIRKYLLFIYKHSIKL